MVDCAYGCQEQADEIEENRRQESDAGEEVKAKRKKAITWLWL